MRSSIRFTATSCAVAAGCLVALTTQSTVHARCEKERRAYVVAKVTIQVKGGPARVREYSIHSVTSTASSKHVSCKAATLKTNNDLRESACRGALSKAASAREGSANEHLVQTLVCRAYAREVVANAEYLDVEGLTAKCNVDDRQSFFDLSLPKGDLLTRDLSHSSSKFTCSGGVPKTYVQVSSWPAPAR